MPLSPLFVVKQNDDGGDEINNFTGWKEVNIGSAVSATVAIATEVKDHLGNTSSSATLNAIGSSKTAQADDLAFYQK